MNFCRYAGPDGKVIYEKREPPSKYLLENIRRHLAPIYFTACIHVSHFIIFYTHLYVSMLCNVMSCLTDLITSWYNYHHYILFIKLIPSIFLPKLSSRVYMKSKLCERSQKKCAALSVLAHYLDQWIELVLYVN